MVSHDFCFEKAFFIIDLKTYINLITKSKSLLIKTYLHENITA